MGCLLVGNWADTHGRKRIFGVSYAAMTIFAALGKLRRQQLSFSRSFALVVDENNLDDQKSEDFPVDFFNCQMDVRTAYYN